MPAFILLGVLVVICFAADLFFGSVIVAPRTVIVALFRPAAADVDSGMDGDTGHGDIVRRFRLPKAIVALIAGAALALAGVQMQTIFANPLAGPFVLGISSGAGVGVALVSFAVGGAVYGPLGMLGAAIAGSAVISLLMLSVSTRAGPVTLLIVGVIIGYAANAVTELLAHFGQALSLRRFVFWTFGDFGAVNPSQMLFFVPIVVAGIIICLRIAPLLDVLTAGDQYARSVGIAVRRVRMWAIVSVVLLAGATVSLCGPIAFIGVIAPHLARLLLVRGAHRPVGFAALFIGAIIALVADCIAAVPGMPLRLPLNAVLGLIGAPIAIVMFLRVANRMEGRFGT